MADNFEKPRIPIQAWANNPYFKVIAPVYNPNVSYASGQLAISPNGMLVKALSDTTGEYDPDKWQETKISEIISGGIDPFAIIIQAESHTTKSGYVVPVLTDDQIVVAYNGVVAGNNVFIVDDLETIVIPVLDASSIEENVSVTAIFRDKLVLTYQVGEDVVAVPIGASVEKALQISDNPSDDKFPTEKAIYNYIASGNAGKPRVLDSVDLDSILATGFYSCNVCTHRPTENNGVMLVIKNAGVSDHAIQVYWTFIADVMWIRHRDHGTWKSWQQLYNKTEVDNLLADINLAIEDLDGNKLDRQQGVGNAGKVLGIGNDGVVAPTELAKTYVFKGYVSVSTPSNAQIGELWYQATAMPTSFPVQVKTYDGSVWSSGTTAYTPSSLELWADLNDNHGYYWFGNSWNIIDVNVEYDNITIGVNALGQLEIKSAYRVSAEEKATWNAKGTYSKPSTGIPKSDLSSGVQGSLSLADTALQQHQSLAAYRTSAAQDVIDNGKEAKGKITISGVEKTANSHTVTIVTNGVTTNLTLVGVS